MTRAALIAESNASLKTAGFQRTHSVRSNAAALESLPLLVGSKWPFGFFTRLRAIDIAKLDVDVLRANPLTGSAARNRTGLVDAQAH